MSASSTPSSSLERASRMSSFTSNFKPILTAVLIVTCVEGMVWATYRPSFAERANYLNWMFGRQEPWHKFLVQTKLDQLTTQSVDVVQVGDSTGFHGVRGDIVTRLLGGVRYVNLSCC